MFVAKISLDSLTGKGFVNVITAVMEENLPDFAGVQKHYLDTMRVLQTELGDDVLTTAQGEMDAIEQQLSSIFLFSAYLGIKANLDNFTDPVARNFLDVDSDVYLREITARSFPIFQNAQNIRTQFYAQLTPAQKEIYEDVIAYTSHLETVGPKLAHYFGYIWGNKILSRLVPGYHADPVQTARYTAMIREYFGKQILLPVL